MLEQKPLLGLYHVSYMKVLTLDTWWTILYTCQFYWLSKSVNNNFVRSEWNKGVDGCLFLECGLKIQIQDFAKSTHLLDCVLRHTTKLYRWRNIMQERCKQLLWKQAVITHVGDITQSNNRRIRLTQKTNRK